MTTSSLPTVVIGAGPVGLTAAVHLVQRVEQVGTSSSAAAAA